MDLENKMYVMYRVHPDFSVTYGCGPSIEEIDERENILIPQQLGFKGRELYKNNSLRDHIVSKIKSDIESYEFRRRVNVPSGTNYDILEYPCLDPVSRGKYEKLDDKLETEENVERSSLFSKLLFG